MHKDVGHWLPRLLTKTVITLSQWLAVIGSLLHFTFVNLGKRRYQHMSMPRKSYAYYSIKKGKFDGYFMPQPLIAR